MNAAIAYLVGAATGGLIVGAVLVVAQADPLPDCQLLTPVVVTR